MNKSLFTKTRRLLHDIEREISESVSNPFISQDDREVFEDIYSQVIYCLEISKDRLL